jgi:hypothetical protein
VSSTGLTGIPVSGIGSILSAVSYNSSITAAPAITGVSGITHTIVKGDQINLLNVVVDTGSTSAVAGLFGDDGAMATYSQDGRISQTEAALRGTATLLLHAALLNRLQWTSHDLNTRARRAVSATLSSPLSVSGTFTIQSVTIAGFSLKAVPIAAVLPTAYPKRAAQAAATRFSLTDFIRALQGAP